MSDYEVTLVNDNSESSTESSAALGYSMNPRKILTYRSVCRNLITCPRLILTFPPGKNSMSVSRVQMRVCSSLRSNRHQLATDTDLQHRSRAGYGGFMWNYQTSILIKAQASAS